MKRIGSNRKLASNRFEQGINMQQPTAISFDLYKLHLQFSANRKMKKMKDSLENGIVSSHPFRSAEALIEILIREIKYPWIIM